MTAEPTVPATTDRSPGPFTGTSRGSAPTSTGTPAHLWGRVAAVQNRFPVVQLVLLAVAFGYGAAALEGFSSATSIWSMLVLASLVGLAGVGQTVVVLIGGFDLSVAGFIVAGALVSTQLTVLYQIPFVMALVLLVFGAAALGGLVGYVCARFSIQPIIVTLAMGALVVGLLQVQTGGNVSGAAPQWLSTLTSPVAATFGLPVPPLLVLWLVIGLLMAGFLHRTAGGRRIYATGANPRAASLALVRTRRVWTLVFAFSAVAAGLAGVLLAGFAGSVDVTLGNPYLFQSLAAVIVGGTAFGGPGDYTRTMLGAVLLTVLTTVLVGLGFTTADQQILYGVIILAAMTLYGRDRNLRDRV
jgi:ribose transport system permease protein